MSRKEEKTNALRRLDRAEITYDKVSYEYDPDDLDVAQIADENGLPLPTIYKTLVCKGDRHGVLVALVPGDKQLDLKKLAAASENKKCALLPIKDLLAHTGYQRGGCSPIGMKRDFPTFLDMEAQQLAEILVNGGRKGLLIALSPEDLGGMVDLHWAAISR